MISKILLFVLFSVCKIFATKEVALQQFVSHDESILCRACGSLITFSKHVTDIRSTASKYTFNDTIFNREQVVVQELLGDFFFHYPVVTFVDSTCSGVGEVIAVMKYELTIKNSQQIFHVKNISNYSGRKVLGFLGIFRGPAFAQCAALI